jgi:hypothetical protein
VARGRGEKSDECSIGPVRARLAWLVGAIGLAGLVAYLRRRGRASVEAAPDPHAEELRRTLEDSRAAAAEQFQEPADEPQTPAGELDARRREVHERGRAALDEMGPRGTSSE